MESGVTLCATTWLINRSCSFSQVVISYISWCVTDELRPSTHNAYYPKALYKSVTNEYFASIQAKPKPFVSLMAKSRRSVSNSFVGYSGKSNVLKQVWPWGSLCTSSPLMRAIVKFWGPLMPCKARKPSSGILLEPVTNCKNEASSSLSKPASAS